MNLFLSLIRSQRPIDAFGFSLTILLIWLLGLLFDVSVSTLLAATLVVVLLWIIYLIYKREKANRSSGEIEKGIKAQADEHMMNVRPEKRRDIEELNQRFFQKIRELKGKMGRGTFYEIPWYVFIGPPGSGKSTVLRNSGLKFPTGIEDEFQGVGGTRNCTFWLANEAIFLDTAGRYSVEADDRDEWLAFLDLLRKHRPRQPINGVLIGMSIDDIMNAKPESLQADALKLRSRISELIQRLRVRFPVYFVITKCDLANGFIEFFENFDAGLRKQVWGATYTKAQQKEPNQGSVFSQEFELLCQRLMQMRHERLADFANNEQQKQLYVFPLEFHALKENLKILIDNLFLLNQYEETPIFRGFYFTSGTQEGVPIDKVINSVALAYGLPPAVTKEFGESEKHSFFINGLLTDVIIPDAKLVLPTTRYERLRRMTHSSALVGAVVLLAAFIFGVSSAFLGSKARLNRAVEASELLNGKQLDDITGTRDLAFLMKTIDTVAHPPFLTFRMDQSSEVLGPLATLYLKKANKIFPQRLFDALDRNLRAFQAGTQTNADTAYDRLKAYLLLSSESQHLIENDDNRSFLVDELDKLPKASAAPWTKNDIRFFVDQFIYLIGKGDLSKRFQNDMNLVTQVRGMVKQPSTLSIYRSLRSRLLRSNEDRNLSLQSLKPPQLPGAFTRTGWQMMEKLIDEGFVAGAMQEQQWVLARKDDENVASISNDIKQKYYDDYAATWQKILSDTRCETFSSLQSCSNALRAFGEEKNSPIRKMIAMLVEETHVDNVGVTLVGKLSSGAEDALSSKNIVNQSFRGAYQLVNGEHSAKFGDIIRQYRELAGELESLGSDPSGNAMRDYALSTLAANGAGFDARKRNIENTIASTGIPDPEKRALLQFLDLPLVESWKTLLSQHQQYLDAGWQKHVVENFKKGCAQFYPFNLNSPDDVSADNVNLLFQTELPAFVSKEIKPFLYGDEGYILKKWMGYGIQISSQAATALQQADELKNVFNHMASRPVYELQVVSVKSTGKKIDNICLKVGSENICYKNEHLPITIKLPWTMDGVEISFVQTHVIGKDEILAHKGWPGPLSMLRLVKLGNPVPRNSARYEGEWKISGPGGEITLRGVIIPSVIRNNPLDRRGAWFSCPDKLE